MTVPTRSHDAENAGDISVLRALRASLPYILVVLFTALVVVALGLIAGVA